MYIFSINIIIIERRIFFFDHALKFLGQEWPFWKNCVIFRLMKFFQSTDFYIHHRGKVNNSLMVRRFRSRHESYETFKRHLVRCFYGCKFYNETFTDLKLRQWRYENLMFNVRLWSHSQEVSSRRTVTFTFTSMIM